MIYRKFIFNPCWLGVAALVLFCTGQAIASSFFVENPSPDPIAGIAAVTVSSRTAGRLETARLLDRAGKEVPFQIQQRGGDAALLIGLTLPGHAVTEVTVADGKRTVAADLITLKNQGDLVIKSPLYTAVFAAAKSYNMTQLSDADGGSFSGLNGRLVLVEDAEQEKYNGHYAGREVHHYQNQSKDAMCRIVSNGPLEATFEISYTSVVGAVTDTITVNALNRLIRHHVEVIPTKHTVQAIYEIQALKLSSKNGEASVYPQQSRVPEKVFPVPGVKFLFNPERKIGVGLMATRGNDSVLNFFWRLEGKQEGVSGDQNIFRLYSINWRFADVTTPKTFAVTVIAGGTPEEAAAYRFLTADRSHALTGGDTPLVNTLTIDKNLVAQKESVIRFAINNAGGNKPSLVVNGRSLSVVAEGNGLFAGRWIAEKSGVNIVQVKSAGRAATFFVEVNKAVSIDKVWSHKLVYKPKAQAKADVILTSHLAHPQQVTVVVSTIFGIDRKTEVYRKTIDLPALERRMFTAEWNSGEMEYGFELLTEVFIDDRLVDQKSRVIAVSENTFRVGQNANANPAWFKNIGQEKRWINVLRNNYFSGFEYYTWTSCPITGLSPEEDVWEPETEAQVTYQATIKKDFIHQFVKAAHDNGLEVTPWLNGEVSLQTGLDNPEMYRYSKGGQPLFYNGVVRKGKRYAIAYSSYLYNEQNAYAFGKEVVKSIDMFGWDACRWDWGFIPSVVGDPMRAGKSSWYTSDGIDSRTIYTDPDAEGTRYLQSFRKAIAEEYPKFIYGTNSSYSREHRDRNPKYTKEVAVDSWLWFEALMSYSIKKHATWQLWSSQMIEWSQVARKSGAQVGTGFMHVYPGGSVSGRLIPYMLLYSGMHWIGSPTGTNNPSLCENSSTWRHAMRYSSYYFNNDFQAISAAALGDKVQCDGDGRLFWQNWVFEKSSAQRRELFINILNLPASDYISQRHEIPPVRKDTTFKVALQPGEKGVRVGLLLAEPVPHFEELTFSRQGGNLVVTIPTIELNCTLLVELEK